MGETAMPLDGRHIGAELRMISNMIYRICNKSPKSDEETAISGGNGWILGYLAANEHRDVFQRDIEKQFRVRRATVSKMICLMEQKGLVERQAVPKDARLKKLVITEKGRRLNAIKIAEFQRIEKNIKKDIPPDKLETFFEVCDMIKNNILTMKEETDE